MTLNNLCAKLELFHDDELPLIEARSVAAHIDSCSACREELSRLCAMEEILKSRVVATDISTVVMERIAALDSGGMRRTSMFVDWMKAPVMALASCVLYVVCVEAGLLPGGQSWLPATVAAHKEAVMFSSMVFGRVETDSEQLLTILLEGEKQ
jgi:anti-sigma factor RsiW